MGKKIAVLTGATGGIGQAVAHAFETLGYRLVLIGRDQHKLDPLLQRLSGGHLTVTADLSLIAENRRIGERILGSFGEVDVLLNVAGTISGARQLTSEGNELTLATNLLGPIALTQALSPRRTVMTGSEAILFAKDLSPADLHSAEKYSGFRAYAYTKACLTLWAMTRDRDRFVSLADPGPTDTPMARNSAVPLLLRLVQPLVRHAPGIAARAFTKAGHSLSAGETAAKVVSPKAEKEPHMRFLDAHAAARLSAAIDPLLSP